ncbi:hypothetical protein [Microbispora sp. H13382]|uniref:hypothetical protein n=1 Tax=Microbispora sp. H13382 TaxID=2729112 RepID=UPI001600FD23|nr:hypothetical protein [Microbispora sp. H13382]
MKRLAVAGVVLGMLTALSAGVGAAHADSPAQPVEALRQQFGAGRGVLVSETARTTSKRAKQTYVTHTTGSIGFGKSGVTGYDLTSRLEITPALEATVPREHLEDLRAPLRAVNVGSDTYVQGFGWGPMPAGKTWTRFDGNTATWGNYGQRGHQIVDVLSPARLKFVISKAVVHRPGEYRGTLRTQDLYAAQGPMNPDRLKVSFRLFVGPDGLPVRLVTRWAEKDYEFSRDDELVRTVYTSVVDTRYHHWGAKVRVTAPPASRVVVFDDLPANQPNHNVVRIP